MNDLKTIVQNNREAEAKGLLATPTAIGTKAHEDAYKRTLGHRQDQPGLRGHSVGSTYPISVVARFANRGTGATIQATVWEVVNLTNNEVLASYDGLPLDVEGCKKAHARAEEEAAKLK